MLTWLNWLCLIISTKFMKWKPSAFWWEKDSKKPFTALPVRVRIQNPHHPMSHHLPTVPGPPTKPHRTRQLQCLHCPRKHPAAVARPTSASGRTSQNSGWNNANENVWVWLWGMFDVAVLCASWGRVKLRVLCSLGQAVTSTILQASGSLALPDV